MKEMTKNKIAVLGAGMIGQTIAIDLSKYYDVTSFDISDKSLSLLRNKSNVKTVNTDLSKYHNYPEILKDFDYVVSAVPGFMGYKTLEAIINSKKDVVDISFFPENCSGLSQLARNNNVTAIIDCGVAPGLSNLILGHLDTKMKINTFECLVGGLPKVRIKPFEYKAPFSPIDVIEEYIRPARYVENGKIVIKPAMSDTQLVNFEEVGTLESFNTDGLRSIVYTMSHIPNMKEKTLRYPGHIDLMKSLFSSGFLDNKPVNLNGQEISPMKFTSTVLFDKWKLNENDEEFTIMDIIASDNSKSINYRLYDEYDPKSKMSSMSRTTGYTCCAAVSLLTNGLWVEKGVVPPELIGRNEACFNHIISYLNDRNINFKIKTT